MSKFAGLCWCWVPRPTPLPAHVPPQPVRVHHGSAVPAPWQGWALSPQGFVRVSLSPFCGSRHLEVLSSPLAHTPTLHTGASVLPPAWLSVPSNCHLFQSPLHCCTTVPLPLLVPALPQAYFPLLFSPSVSVLQSWHRDSHDLCSREPPGPPCEDKGGTGQRPEGRGSTTRVLGTSSQLMIQ